MFARSGFVAPWCALVMMLANGCASETGDIERAEPLGQEDVEEKEQALAARKHPRGTLLRSERLRRLNLRQVRRELADEDFDVSAVKYGVELYRLLYTTVDTEGKPIVASGLFVIPRNGERRLKLVSSAHGTELFKGDAPSFGEDTFIIGAPLTFASAGYAVAAPDYVGLGLGSGPHPYMHLPTEVSASLDMLRASATFATRIDKTVERAVYVTGFSQGSLAALGLARLLETTPDSGFSLSALAPVSGPYEVRRWFRAALDPDGGISAKDATMYLAYLSVAWNRIYGLYDAPGEFFRAPYADGIEPLLDNTHEGLELAEATPDTPLELLTPEAVARYRDPDPILAEPIDELGALCNSWTPRAPVRLYAATGDEQVPYWNSVYCDAALRERGHSPTLVDLGPLGHLESNVAAAREVLVFFDSL